VTDRRLRGAIALLALVGTGIAGYLTWVHYQPDALVCLRGSSGCETVQQSRYAELAGMPVALLGLLSYLALLAAAFMRGVLVAAAAAALSLAGLAFAGWLVYVMAEKLDAWCVWCIASDVVLTLLTVACLLRAWRATAETAAV
jgi:uncharacterized membrane protein